jgi:phosphate transport system substrate-binding protein
MQNGARLSKEVGYIALPDVAYELAWKRYQDRKTGSVFNGAPHDSKVEELLAK